MGIYTGIKNTEDTKFQVLNLPQLEGEVRVYRDEFGVPSIIADNIYDLLFAQGYEITRDRSFQMEYYRALINGEFARMLGPDLVDTDITLRDMGLRRAADKMMDKLEPEHMKIVNAYANGVNTYIDAHMNSLPFELQLLGVEPKHWDSADVVAMGSIVAFSWALGGMGEELLRLETHRKFGNDAALELFPVKYPSAENYLKNLDHELIENNGTNNTIEKNIFDALKPVFGSLNTILQNNLMSNNWVISGSKTNTGKPLLANDPHQGLGAQGIWYRVNLFLRDNTLNLQGFTFPGIPLITFGHNNRVAWGITAGLHDTTDLLYLNTDKNRYLINNTDWLEFDSIESVIEVKGDNNVKHITKLSIYGPMIDTPEGEMAMRWTLHEGYERDQPFRSLIDFNFARNVDEFHEALRYLLTGFNFVFADIDGNIASQVSGILPIRSIDNGLLPQNGSSGKNDWIGIVPYEDMYYVKNPIEGYLVTANERVDSRELFFQGESFAHRYRDDRISQLINNGTDLINPNNISSTDVQIIQTDTKTLVADDLLDPVIDILQNFDFKGDNSNIVKLLIDDLSNWDKRLEIDSVEATVFVTYRYFLTEVTFRDDIGDLTDSYYYTSVKTLADWIKNDRDKKWFDDNRTEIIENADDMVVIAMNNSIDYLINRFGKNTEKWKWGNLHRVYLPHALSSVTKIFDIGGDPIAGGVFTILSSTEHGKNGNDIDYSSTKAPYFRFIMEVESTWSNVRGAVSSGASDHPLSKHYDDAYKSWLANEYILWLSDINSIESTYVLTAIFRRDQK